MQWYMLPVLPYGRPGCEGCSGPLALLSHIFAVSGITVRLQSLTSKMQFCILWGMKNVDSKLHNQEKQQKKLQMVESCENGGTRWDRIGQTMILVRLKKLEERSWTKTISVHFTAQDAASSRTLLVAPIKDIWAIILSTFNMPVELRRICWCHTTVIFLRIFPCTGSVEVSLKCTSTYAAKTWISHLKMLQLV